MNNTTLFESFNGKMNNSFPYIHTPVLFSPSGVPYLQAPGVALIALPTVNMAGLAGFLDGFESKLRFSAYLEDDPLAGGAQLCKIAGQVCYMSFGPKRTHNINAATYFDNIKSSGHGSVLEHANYSMLLYGVSRSLTHELIRHRAGFSFSQLSQRYVSGKTLRFVERPEYCVNEQFHTQFLQRIERSANEYAVLTNQLLEMQKSGKNVLSADNHTDLRKKVQQTARSILPNEVETIIVITGNVRAWRHFIEMRASTHAELEIRNLAVRIFLCLYHADPVLFDDYVIQPLEDGTYIVQTEFKKV